MFGIGECCLPDEPMMDVGDIRTILDDCDFEFSHAYPYCALKDAPAACWTYGPPGVGLLHAQSEADRHATSDGTYMQLGSSIHTDRSAFYPYPGRTGITAPHAHALMPAFAPPPRIAQPTYGSVVNTAVEQAFKLPSDVGSCPAPDRLNFPPIQAQIGRFAPDPIDVHKARLIQTGAIQLANCQYSPVTPIDVHKPSLDVNQLSSMIEQQAMAEEKPTLITLKDTIRERVQSRMRALGKTLLVADDKPKAPEKLTQVSIQKRLVRRERNKVAARRTRARRKELEEGLNAEKRRLLKIVNKRKELLAKLSNEFRQLRQLTISHLASDSNSCTNRHELLKFLHTAYESQPDMEAADGDLQIEADV